MFLWIVLGHLNGCVFFWYRDVFFVVSRWPKSPFWYRDLFFGIEILHSVVHHLDCLLPGVNPCVLFLGLDILRIGRSKDLDTEKKIKKSRYPKQDITIPTKRVTLKYLNCLGKSGKDGQPASITSCENPLQLRDAKLARNYHIT